MIKRRAGAGLFGLTTLLASFSAVGCQSRPPGHITIRVAQAVALVDAIDPIQISGLPPRSKVKVLATATDAGGVRFTSSATFRAGASGRVDLTRTAPISGSYQGVASMGLFWSMRPVTGGSDYSDDLARRGQVVTLTATAAGRSATTTLTRLPSAAGVTESLLRPTRDGVYGELFLPRQTAHATPAVVVFGGSEGGLSLAPTASLLASHGFPTLALAYFGEPGLPAHLERIPLEYFVKAVRLLARQRDVDASRIVLDGASRGSEAALLVAAHYPALVYAAVALVPSDVVNSGFPDSNLPAWTIGGRPLPRQFGFGDPVPLPPSAAIPVEHIGGPIFMDCGGYDGVWPSCPAAAEIVSRLRRFHRPAPTLLEYQNAGHAVGYLVPNLAVSFDSLATSGATAETNFVGRTDAWPRLLHFLAALR
jgi:dienelactone hydrolase